MRRTVSATAPIRKSLATVLACLMAALPLSNCGSSGSNSSSAGSKDSPLPPATTPTEVTLTPPTITSFQPMSGAPFSLISISGQNFNPSVVSGVTFSDRSGFSCTVSALLVDSTTVLTAVPPYFDSSGNFTTGSVTIEVNQSSGRNAATSNVLGTFQIQALVPGSPLASGSLTLAWLQTMLQGATSLPNSIVGTPLSTPAMQAALSVNTILLQNSVAQVQSVTSGGGSFTIGQQNGTDITVSSVDLAIADRLLVGFLTAVSSPTPAGSFESTLSGRPSSTTQNPIQLTAQEVLALVANKYSTQAELINALQKFVTSFAIADPGDAQTVVEMVFGGLAVGAVIDLIGAPTLVLAGWLEMKSAIAALGGEVTLQQALRYIAITLVGV